MIFDSLIVHRQFRLELLLEIRFEIGRGQSAFKSYSSGSIGPATSSVSSDLLL